MALPLLTFSRVALLFWDAAVSILLLHVNSVKFRNFLWWWISFHEFLYCLNRLSFRSFRLCVESIKYTLLYLSHLEYSMNLIHFCENSEDGIFRSWYCTLYCSPIFWEVDDLLKLGPCPHLGILSFYYILSYWRSSLHPGNTVSITHEHNFPSDGRHTSGLFALQTL